MGGANGKPTRDARDAATTMTTDDAIDDRAPASAPSALAADCAPAKLGDSGVATTAATAAPPPPKVSDHANGATDPMPRPTFDVANRNDEEYDLDAAVEDAGAWLR